MRWQDVIEHPSLQDLPFKIELDEYGNILMSPASNRHGRLQLKLASLLEPYPGELFLECSITTRKGVKVADVAWCSDAFFQRFGEQTPLPAAPELCVEILSPSNSAAEKIDLYLAKGAKEVWLCDDSGAISVYNPLGNIPQSELFVGFPQHLFDQI